MSCYFRMVKGENSQFRQESLKDCLGVLFTRNVSHSFSPPLSCGGGVDRLKRESAQTVWHEQNARGTAALLLAVLITPTSTTLLTGPDQAVPSIAFSSWNSHRHRHQQESTVSSIQTRCSRQNISSGFRKVTISLVQINK